MIVKKYQTTQLIGAFNKLNGFQIDDSQVKYQGILRGHANDVDGISAAGSRVGVMGAFGEYNNHIGLQLDSTQFTYNIGASRYFEGYDSSVSSWWNRAGHSGNTPAICTEQNGLHNINITNSSQFSDSRIDNSGSRAGLIGGRKGGGNFCQMWANTASSVTLGVNEAGNVPLIKVSNNSYGRFLGLAAIYDRVNSAGAYVQAQASVKGRVLSVTDNSNVDLYGTSAFNTNMTGLWAMSNGVSTLQNTWLKAAVYAGNNSRVRISGPTKICKIGVDVLAENGSKIEIGPALDKSGGHDQSLSPLDPSGHTRLELHSTRACLVVNNNSTLDMQKVGASPDHGTSSINQASRNQEDDVYHSGSFVQFYPNAYSQVAWTVSGGSSSGMDYQATLDPDSSHLRTVEGIAPIGTPVRTNHNLASTGGMCVRAVGGSNVNVDQVNFEVHMPAADLSGAYYNIDGSGYEGKWGYAGSSVGLVTEHAGTELAHFGGSQIFIWNIADTSRIIASNLKVNGVGGAAAGYQGPCGRWGHSNASQYGSAMMGPLDYFGVGGYWNYLKAAGLSTPVHSNYGPFRLFCGVSSDLMCFGEMLRKSDGGHGKINYDPAVEIQNNFTYGGSPIAQINAQGYASMGVAASSVRASDSRGFINMEMAVQANSGSPDSHHQPIFGARFDASFTTLTTSAIASQTIVSPV